MLVRIVKLSFEPKNSSAFLENFEIVKHQIRNFQGCNFLELYNDLNQNNVFFTYSYWDDDSALENYRNSDLFKTVWKKTKPLFNAKPEAWSVTKMCTLD